MFQGLLLASCFVVVWILSSISSIFVLCHLVIAPSITLTGFFTDVVNMGKREALRKGNERIKVGTKLS